MVTASRQAGVTTARPPSVIAAIGVLWFTGLTAIGGGIGFFFDIGMRNEEWLEQIPVLTNWALPGILLGVVFGLGSLVTAFGVTNRPHWVWMGWLERATHHHWSWLFTGLLGLGMMIWIGLQLLWIDPSFLHAIYGVVGVSLLTLALSPSVRNHLRVDE